MNDLPNPGPVKEVSIEIPNFLQDLLENIPNVLKFGFMGAGLFLAIATLFLIILEQRKEMPRIGILLTIYSFMFFSFSIILLGFISNPAIINMVSLTELIKPVDGVEVIDAIKEKVSTDLDGDALANAQKVEYGEMQTVSLYNDADLWEFIRDSEDSIMELDICGAHLQNGVGRIKESIRKILEQGGTVKILVTNLLDTNSINYQNNRKLPPIQFQKFQGMIQRTLIDLKEIGEETHTGNLIVSTINRPLDERMHKIINKKNEELIYVKQYPFRNEGGSLFGGLMFFAHSNRNDEQKIFSFYDEKLKGYFTSGIEEYSTAQEALTYNYP